jgi:FkbM family methyltransferase
MESVAANYKPSLINPGKYLIYADYFKEYLVCKDFKSLKASLKYVFSHKLPKEGYTTSSKMGDFFIRPGTTDFQFINFAYERKVKEYILQNIGSFDVFIDIGACIGEYCIWIAKLGKQCIAVEPVNFEAIQKNVSLNKLENSIQVFPVGAGSKKEKVFFNIPVGLASSSHIDRETDKTPNVEIEMFDTIAEKLNIPETARILVKMDVEGMETEVIAGAGNFIRKYKNLRFIYEHFETDEYRNDKALSAFADFAFSDIDKVNRLAVKK